MGDDAERRIATPDLSVGIAMTACCCFFETPRSVSPEGTGAKLDKTPPKFRTFKFLPDERRKSPCRKTAAPKPAAGEVAGRYGGGSIIMPENKPLDRACRSRGARDAAIPGRPG